MWRKKVNRERAALRCLFVAPVSESWNVLQLDRNVAFNGPRIGSLIIFHPGHPNIQLLTVGTGLDFDILRVCYSMSCLIFYVRASSKCLPIIQKQNAWRILRCHWRWNLSFVLRFLCVLTSSFWEICTANVVSVIEWCIYNIRSNSADGMVA